MKHFRVGHIPSQVPGHHGRYHTICNGWFRFKNTTTSAAAVTCQACIEELVKSLDRKLMTTVRLIQSAPTKPR